MARLKLEFEGGQELLVALRGDATETVRELLACSPFNASAVRWGDEVYFETPASCPLESDARDEMSVGDVAYWPDGRALAIFFGRTPVSIGDEPRAYSPCNIVGTVEAGLDRLGSVRTGEKVAVSASE